MCKIISTSSFVCNHLFHWTPLVNGSGISGANRILIFIYTRVWEGSECVFVNSSGSRWCIWILNHRNEPQGRTMCLLVELTAFYLLLFWINPALSADSSLSDHPVYEWWHQWLIWEEFTLFFIHFVMMFIRRGLHEVPGSCSVENSQWHTCNLCGHFLLISASLLPFFALFISYCYY